MFLGILLYIDRFTQHRYKADQAFLLAKSKSPVAAYLDIDTIVKICKENSVEAVHPGYGFLSENEKFAAALERNGIVSELVFCCYTLYIYIYLYCFQYAQYLHCSTEIHWANC